MIPRTLILPKNRSFFLFGPRLVGKSTWLKHSLPPDSFKIDLLHEGTYQTYLTDSSRFVDEVRAFEKRKPSGWVCIDEVQRIPALLNEVQSLMESSKLRFALSGSSARKLKRGGGNLLGGRANDLKMFSATSIEQGEDFSLKHAIKWGSLPAVLTSDDEDKKQILRAYISTYMREEIQAEGIVRNLPSFARFLQLAAENIGQELNYSSIASETSVTSKTIKEYFQILDDTLLGTILPPWKKMVRKQLAGSPKFYFFDNGVTNALRENLSHTPTGHELGQIFEQTVIQEVRALLSYMDFEGQLYFWRARGGNEVDILISRGPRPLLAIEVKATERPGPRDFAGLLSFAEEYPKVPKILVTRQPRASLFKDIEALPYVEFMKRLSGKEYLN